MLPRWHIIFGAVLTLFIWTIFPKLHFLYLILIFLSSFLIDFDHYVNATLRNKSFSLDKAFEYYEIKDKILKEEIKKGIKKKEDEFQFFHPIEVHVAILVLGFLWQGFWFIFIGMLFHSLLDVASMYKAGYLHRREYFLVNWIRRKF